jgi:hypothetical protein
MLRFHRVAFLWRAGHSQDLAAVTTDRESGASDMHADRQ